MTRSTRSHRNRLLEAMIVTAARYGYGETSVARVIAQAGVSRATFYANFSGKEDCFLVAYRQIALRVWRDIDGVASRLAPADRLKQAISVLLSRAERYPAATRVFLIESLAGDAAVRSEHERLLIAIEHAIDARLGELGGSSVRVEIPARVALGAIASIVSIRVFRGEASGLSGLTDDLLAWLESYAVPAELAHRTQAEWTELGKRFAAGRAGPSGRQKRLPRGRSALPPAVVASEHRDRILDAVGVVARKKGYAGSTVADLVAAAGVTREVFYE
jgi:AcrR family transcriptional regulator